MEERALLPTGIGFARLWSARAVSQLGDGVTTVAGPLLAASLTREPLLVAGAAFAARLPFLLLSLPGGALVDRLDRRAVMVAADTLRALAMGGLAAAVALGAVNLPVLYAVFFVLGVGETMFDTASLSILPTIVPPDGIERANSRLSGAEIVAQELAGPPIGGLLFALAAALPMALDAVTFWIGVVLVASLPGAYRVQAPTLAAGQARPTLLQDIREGVRWLAAHRLLRTLTLSIGLMNVTLAATTSVMVLVAQERLGLGPIGYGVLLAAMAVGGIAASACAERVIGRIGAATALRAGLVIEASTQLVLALAKVPVVAGVALAVFGFHCVVWTVVTTSLRQQLVPDRLLGRVMSASLLFGAGGLSLGALLGGLLADAFGLTAPFWVASAAVAGLAVAAWPALGDAAGLREPR
jgi:MFS family permease